MRLAAARGCPREVLIIDVDEVTGGVLVAGQLDVEPATVDDADAAERAAVQTVGDSGACACVNDDTSDVRREELVSRVMCELHGFSLGVEVWTTCH